MPKKHEAQVMRIYLQHPLVNLSSPPLSLSMELPVRIMGKDFTSHQDSGAGFRNLGLEHFIKDVD